jgi:hypothetical protein
MCLTVCALLLVTGCSDSGPSVLPSQLWLALDGDEQHVKLTTAMPTPY